MTDRLRDLIRRLRHAQRGLLFKAVASGVIVLLAVLVLSYQGLAAARDAQDAAAARAPAAEAEEAGEGPGASDDFSRTRAAIESMLAGRTSVAAFATGVAVGAGLALVVVWLGLALTYLVLVAIALVVAWLVGAVFGADGLARLLLGVVALTAAFTILMQGLRALFAGPGPVFAIARNTLAEAVRLKLSLVFIVLLVFALAAMPALIDSQDDLRYRVQSLLQYGTGGSFWIIGLLVVLFSVATVAFDQRDKTIWQTMTKPVASWQYILGRWLGVAGLAAVLLAVTGAGVFLFTEYLRGQRATDEVAPFVAESGEITEDRLILESQVLTARVSREPVPGFARDDEEFLADVGRYIERQRMHNPDFATDEAQFQEVLDSLYKSAVANTYRLPPAQWRAYLFEGLSNARRSERPITVSFKVETEMNEPTHFYEVIFGYGQQPATISREIALGTTGQITIPNEAIAPDGRLELYMVNNGLKGARERSETLRIPVEEGGLRVSYSVGGYRMNFARVVFVLWVKLAFLAMIGIMTATFLSFPVAVLVTFAVFLAAEATGYLTTSLESYGFQDREGNLIFWKWLVVQVSGGITNVFAVYADLRPTTRLVEGRLLGWSSVAVGTAVLATLSALLYALSVVILRRRELAIYSGS